MSECTSARSFTSQCCAFSAAGETKTILFRLFRACIYAQTRLPSSPSRPRTCARSKTREVDLTRVKGDIQTTFATNHLMFISSIRSNPRIQLPRLLFPLAFTHARTIPHSRHHSSYLPPSWQPLLPERSPWTRRAHLLSRVKRKRPA